VREALAVDRDALVRALGAEIRRSRLGCVALPLDVFRAAVASARVPR
jgi:hypothetical protein